MGLRFTILASGSTGNSMLVAARDAKVLVDVGLSVRKIEGLLAEVGVSPEELDAVLITHEHVDHVRGAGAFARKYRLPVYANEKTWRQLERQFGGLDPAQRRVFVTGSELWFGSLRVESFELSHDAAEPVGFSFAAAGYKLGLATDLGYVSRNVMEAIRDSDVLIIESNHDVEMLRAGRYPWNVKRRILGDKGHLSNEAAGEALCELLSPRTKRVYLAHLSRDHNLADLARLTVNNILEERGVYRRCSVRLMDTYFDRPTPWDDLTMTPIGGEIADELVRR
ncbi:MAG: MBL fold metallo-hydrolase [Candidatus Reconcilbacillus cellulovorans]|uniref:MBL fold metallo-hydrolase n=1 Tax=Candidatus Reconcilbacillus cellulovorans TaxID=1906605 RepID=A0A2A6DZW8_9BACL|nr:MAG: MBL fold metallo-hydrolase [Candidatus Reconcilbacillus cellulovorans]